MNRRRFALAGLSAIVALVIIYPRLDAANSEEPSTTAPTEQTSAAEAGADATGNPEPEEEQQEVTKPLIILGVGMAVVLGLIIGLKLNAFLALITAAMVVSLLAVGLLGGDWWDSIARVAGAFGKAAGGIGIVIGMAAVIGKCMLDSGAADRIVRAFVKLFGEKRSPMALTGSGFVLAIPVFFDTVFYLLVPLARSLYRRTQKRYLLYVLAIACGGAITHTLVPPTPGPLVMATTLGIDVGLMILIGGLVALPSAAAGLIFSDLLDRWMPIPMRSIGDQPEPEPLKDSELPSLWLSLLPVVLPVLMISTNTVVETTAKSFIRKELIEQKVEMASEEINDKIKELLRQPEQITDATAKKLAECAGVTNVFGNPNFALLVSTIIAIWTLVKQRGLTRGEMATAIETALMSGGVIILITAGGGAFGDMLTVAQVGEAIKVLFAGPGGGGIWMLVLAFGVSAVLKIAQGSSTIAMITSSAMLAGIASPETLGFHPVYLATAIGGGSLIGSWMNDSGFWIFSKMSGLTEVEALRSWTIMLIVLGTVSFGVTVLLATVMPLAG
ncbi:MAG: gluconate permease [Planctomycetes bacterium]|nr:gluconate permease [Planctomycetota bacterium]MBL7038259.1 gluconate permease [Pirellulaceae bacterium]